MQLITLIEVMLNRQLKLQKMFLLINFVTISNQPSKPPIIISLIVYQIGNEQIDGN